MKRSILLATVLLIAVSATADSHGYTPSNGLIFGNGTLQSGTTKPTNGQAVCNNNGVLGGCGGGSFGFAPQRYTISAATFTMPGCLTLVCSYVLTLTTQTAISITLPPSLDGQALTIKVLQDNSGNHTPTFVASSGYSLNWANGAPVAAVLTANKAQMYELWTDLSSQPTPVYNEMRPGPE